MGKTGRAVHETKSASALFSGFAKRDGEEDDEASAGLFSCSSKKSNDDVPGV